jgi:hypothetical protein
MLSPCRRGRFSEWQFVTTDGYRFCSHSDIQPKVDPGSLVGKDLDVLDDLRLKARSSCLQLITAGLQVGDVVIAVLINSHPNRQPLIDLTYRDRSRRDAGATGIANPAERAAINNLCR